MTEYLWLLGESLDGDAQQIPITSLQVFRSAEDVLKHLNIMKDRLNDHNFITTPLVFVRSVNDGNVLIYSDTYRAVPSETPTPCYYYISRARLWDNP